MDFKRFLATCTLITLIPSSLFATPSTIKKECPNANPYHLIVNKTQSIPKDFVPTNLVVPNIKFSFTGYHEKKNLEQTTSRALENLFAAARKDGITLAAVSGYRSYSRQADIYSNYVKRDGQKKADTYSARPGTSEHQTGLAMDVSAPSVNFQLTEQLGNTKEGKWLAAHAHEYGFIIRYPKGKEPITGYIYEPWHLRYVGQELAKKVYTTGLTLEELDTCCEVQPTIEPDPQPQPSQPSISIDSSAIIGNQIEIVIDQSLKDLQITVIQEDNTYKIVIKPSSI